MSVKRRKMGMSHKQRLIRAVGLWSAFLMLLSCFALITVMIMDIAGFNLLEAEQPRMYWIQFQSEERILVDLNYRRGEKIDKPGDPKHSKDEYFEYTFRGWDISGDNSPDFIPSHAYYSFLAVAVFQKRQIKPLPKSTSEEDSSEEELNSGMVYLDYEVESYGA